MKQLFPHDIIFGVNDTSHFVHEASKRKASGIPLNKFFNETKEKRKWSIVNPGFILSLAYSYLVFGHEKELLKSFNMIKFNFTVSSLNYSALNDKKKNVYLKRRLRNAIAHCRYEVEIRTDNGEINKDSDVWFVFNDQKDDGTDKFTMSISFPEFGNLIENVGLHCYTELQKK